MLDSVRAEFVDLVEALRAEDTSLSYDLKDLMIVHPTMTDPASKLVSTMREVLSENLNREIPLIASPGTYDQKHFARIAGIEQCIAYGPGILNMAHQPDEYCEVEHLKQATKAMAIGAMRLLGTAT